MLTIGESWPAWHALARRAVWLQEGSSHDVLALLTVQPVDDLEALRDEAADAMAIRGPGVLPLLGIEAVGDGAAWLYPDRTVLSPAWFAEPTLGHRAGAELVRDVARVVLDHPHPGPAMHDVLLDGDGNVCIANYVGPLSHVVQTPGQGSAEAQQVYRLGVLLATLLAGGFKCGTSAATHDAALRRTVIRAMSMPGAVFSDQYADWLRGMLAWNPDARPPLTRLIDGLHVLTETSGGLPLIVHARRDFEGWLISARHTQLPEEETLRVGDVSLDPEYAGRTTLAHERIIGDLAIDDDMTVETEFPDPVEHTPPSVLERGTIPVEVGPPAEAIHQRRPTLPPGFLDPNKGDTVPQTPGRTIRPPTTPSSAAEPNWMLPAAFVLTGLAVLLMLWLVAC